MRDSAEIGNGAGARDRAARYRRSAGLALVATAAAVVLAGCGGSTSPSVATLATTTSHSGSDTSANSSAARAGGGGSRSALASGNPSELLVAWAACMRSHGDPNQADPSIDPHKVIHIPWNPAVPGGYNGTNKGGQGNVGPGHYCRTYLAKAQNALQRGQAQAQPSNAQLVQFSECMRANGIRDFPDPTGNGDLHINRGGGGDLNPNNPAFQRASNLCSQRTGVPGFSSSSPAPGTIQLSNP
jgi:hypothetical protein